MTLKRFVKKFSGDGPLGDIKLVILKLFFEVSILKFAGIISAALKYSSGKTFHGAIPVICNPFKTPSCFRDHASAGASFRSIFDETRWVQEPANHII
jgi:hypothetical protein